VVTENYETGAVRAEYWDAKREIENLKEFMAQEGYREDEVDKIVSGIDKNNKHLMEKYMRRMRLMIDGDRKLLPIVWNRWRQYVAMRKLIRYHLKHCQNMVHSDHKAELKIAFERWRRHQKPLERDLGRMQYKELMELSDKTADHVGQWAQEIEENQAIQDHLLVQRDEFLNFYVKAQILGLALIKDRAKLAKFQA
jgi:hypothetical protein